MLCFISICARPPGCPMRNDCNYTTLFWTTARRDQAPSFSGALSVAWDYIQPTLDEDNLRYEETRKKRASSGSKGGLAKARNAKQAAAKLANLANSIQFNTTELNKKTGKIPRRIFPLCKGKPGRPPWWAAPLPGSTMTRCRARSSTERRPSNEFRTVYCRGDPDLRRAGSGGHPGACHRRVLPA